MATKTKKATMRSPGPVAIIKRSARECSSITTGTVFPKVKKADGLATKRKQAKKQKLGPVSIIQRSAREFFTIATGIRLPKTQRNQLKALVRHSQPT
jgi:hypothetical protein